MHLLVIASRTRWAWHWQLGLIKMARQRKVSVRPAKQRAGQAGVVSEKCSVAGSQEARIFSFSSGVTTIMSGPSDSTSKLLFVLEKRDGLKISFKLFFYKKTYFCGHWRVGMHFLVTSSRVWPAMHWQDSFSIRPRQWILWRVWQVIGQTGVAWARYSFSGHSLSTTAKSGNLKCVRICISLMLTSSSGNTNQSEEEDDLGHCKFL